MDCPFVSIVIPVRNREGLLSECLQSIRRLTYPAQCYEVIVVDGASTDGTAAIARTWGATVLPNPERHICPGRNIGVAAARGEIVAFCDSDCTVHPEWLTHAVRYCADAMVGGVGGPIHTPAQGMFAQSVALFFELSVRFANAAHSSEPGPFRPVRHIPTCNLVARRDALERVFPIAWNAAYGSDLELSRRLRAAGFGLFLTPDVEVWHHKRTTPLSFFRQLYHYGSGFLCAARRDWRILTPVHLVAIPFAPVLVVVACCGVVSLPILTLALGAVGALALLLIPWAVMHVRRWDVALCLPFTLCGGLFAWSLGFLVQMMPRFAKRAGS